MTFKQLWERFINIIDRFLQKKTNYTEDLHFFENDINLYNVDGTLTQSYKIKIKEYEKYLLDNQISDYIIDNESNDNIDISVMQSIKEFTDKRSEIMNEYDLESQGKGSLFSPIMFIKEKSTLSVESLEEKEDVVHTINEILEADALDMLANPEVKELLSQTINGDK